MQKRARVLGFGLMLPLAALFALACGPSEVVPDAGPDEETGCRRNIECGGGSICEKATPEDEVGVCIPVFCVSDEGCADDEYCDLSKGLCINENTCDPGNPGDVCADGEVCTYVDGDPQCTPPGELPGATACRISPSPVFVSAGSTIELHGVGLNATNKLVPFVDFTFAQTGDVGTITGNQLAATCATGVCSGSVTATASRGGATCTADVKVYAAPAATELRVALFDATTGLPVAGAAAAITVAGAPVSATSPTNADGVTTFPIAAIADVQAVSVFPTNHQWQTVMAPGSNDVALYTVPVPDETEVAGVKGEFDFSQVTTQGDIKLGLAGMSIGGAITDLDFATLIGEIANYNIVLEGVTDADGEQVPLPSGLVLELGAEKIKGDFVTLGEEGLRVLWALGGRVRLSQIGGIISSVTASDDINVGQVLSSVLPFFAKFDHATVSGLELQNVARPASLGEDIPIPYDSWNFQELKGANAVKLNTLITQKAVYTVPTLPCVPGQGTAASCTDSAHASGAVLLSGSIVPGIGLVPLGLTAGLDDPDDQDNNDQRDGRIDYIDDPADPAVPPAAGDARIDYAPPHDGLEGSQFVTIAIALDINGLAAGSLGASTITHITDSYGATNTFPGSFLEHQGGTWDITSDNDRTFTLQSVGTADFYRLNLNNGENEWNIWFPTGTTSVSTAALRPSALAGQREFGADIQAFRLGTGYAGLKPDGFGDLVKFNGTNFDGLLYYMGGWSSQACADAVDGEATPHCERVGGPTE